MCGDRCLEPQEVPLFTTCQGTCQSVEIPCNGTCPTDTVPCADLCLTQDLAMDFHDCDGDPLLYFLITGFLPCFVLRCLSAKFWAVSRSMQVRPDPMQRPRRRHGLCGTRWPGLCGVRGHVPTRVHSLQWHVWSDHVAVWRGVCGPGQHYCYRLWWHVSECEPALWQHLPPGVHNV